MHVWLYMMTYTYSYLNIYYGFETTILLIVNYIKHLGSNYILLLCIKFDLFLQKNTNTFSKSVCIKCYNCM